MWTGAGETCVLKVSFFWYHVLSFYRNRVCQHRCFIPGVSVLQRYHGVVFVLLLPSFQEGYSLGGLSPSMEHVRLLHL